MDYRGAMHRFASDMRATIHARKVYRYAPARRHQRRGLSRCAHQPRSGQLYDGASEPYHRRTGLRTEEHYPSHLDGTSVSAASRVDGPCGVYHLAEYIQLDPADDGRTEGTRLADASV